MKEVNEHKLMDWIVHNDDINYVYIKQGWWGIIMYWLWIIKLHFDKD